MSNFPISERFSPTKSLYPYQIQALQNAYKVLKLYFADYHENKQLIFKEVYQQHVEENYDLKVKGKITDYLPIQNGKIHISNIINRASFWMATGSGKTLVIVKLIELLKVLTKSGEIPEKDILFLTAREDLISQFIKHVEEYNSYIENPYKIELVPLSEFEREKSFGEKLFKEQVRVFYYRSDLLTDEAGEKRLDFESFYNNGNWYLILDEAHKGDKSESKAQAIFTIMSINGFMFNFSATFTEEIDFWTCAYEYNLSSFIRDGYGKHVYISSKSLEEFDRKKAKDFPEKVKTITVLKTLMLHTWLCKIKKELGHFYPRPLTLVLANSVNTEDADLQMFFNELVKIAQGKIEKEAFETLKKELFDELRNVKCVFTNVSLNEDILSSIKNLTFEDVLSEFFHATAPSEIEARVLPENMQEIAFALKSSPKAFGLIKIGDISNWLKEKLSGFEIVEVLSQDSYFKSLNESELNLLMGSRAFYEGWDNPRPNVLLYLNIGKESAKKFVLQSLGRGVRVNPVGGKKRRIEFLEERSNIHFDKASALEFLYVFGTKADALEKIVLTVQEERKKARNLIELEEGLIEINHDIRGKLLLAPEYQFEKTFVEKESSAKFKIAEDDYNMIIEYLKNVPEVVLIFRHGIRPSILTKIKNMVKEKRNIFVSKGFPSYLKPEMIIERFVKFLESESVVLEVITELNLESIVHFKHVRLSEGKLEKIRKSIELSKRGKDRTYDSIKIMRLHRHYYQPILVTNDEKVDYAEHIITHKSEVKFIEELDEKEEDIFTDFDWWFFSKIDESTDTIYIPYHEDALKFFYPDFIFWLRKDDFYVILFVDPKGTAHASTYVKIDGYRQLFEENGKPKVFEYNDLKVIVLLALYNEDLRNVPNDYKRHWVKDLEELEEFVKKSLLQVYSSVQLRNTKGK